MAQLLKIKAQVSSIWAKGSILMTVCVLSDLKRLPLLGGGRKSWYIITKKFKKIKSCFSRHHSVSNIVSELITVTNIVLLISVTHILLLFRVTNIVLLISVTNIVLLISVTNIVLLISVTNILLLFRVTNILLLISVTNIV